MERFSDLLKGKLAFGCMRMQLDANGEVDMDNFREMVDLFLDAGFNYFDTAQVYYEGKSEVALREGLTSRYPLRADRQDVRQLFRDRGGHPPVF